MSDARRGRRGVQHDARLFAEAANGLQRAMQMRPRLDMHRDEIGAGFREGGEIGIAGRDHQMHVEEEIGMRAQARRRSPGRS